MDLAAARQSMATQIASVVPAPLSAYWYVPDAVTTPAFYIKPTKLDYDRTFRKTQLGEMEVVVLVSRADDLSGQTNLDPYLDISSAYSIKAALEAARTQYGGAGFAGGIVDLWVSGVAAYQHYDVAGIVFLGATFTVMFIGEG